MKLFGKHITPLELRKRTGLIDQVAGVRLVTFDDGHARGARAALVQTGSGLDFTILIDRCLDLGSVTYNGAALGWRSSVGDVAPQYFEPEHLRWLRSFQGGLLATCGLSNVGAPQSQSEVTGLGLHGRIGATPAQDVCVFQGWEGNEYVMRVTGLMREASVFGEKLALRRTITTRLGVPRIEVHDELVNEGFHATPFQLLYHVNVGWPVVDAGARVLAPSRAVAPRDEIAQAGIATWNELGAPVHGYREQVFYHDMQPAKDGTVTVGIVNGDFTKPGNLGLYLRYSAATLPRFGQWKMMGEQEYVVGLEPANCGVQGRAHDEADGLLRVLKPGERQIFDLEFGVVTDAAGLKSLRASTRGGKSKVVASYRDFMPLPGSDHGFGATAS